MLDSKFFLKSKTIWGVIVTFAPALLAAVGIDGTADWASVDSAAVGLLNAFDQLNEAVGAALVVWGRWTADKALTLK